MGFTFLILQGLQCCRVFDSSLLVGQSMLESFADEKGVVGLLVLLLVPLWRHRRLYRKREPREPLVDLGISGSQQYTLLCPSR